MIRELHVPEAGEPVHQGWVLLDHRIKDVLRGRKASAQVGEEDSKAPLLCQQSYGNAEGPTTVEEGPLPDRPARWRACS